MKKVLEKYEVTPPPPPLDTGRKLNVHKTFNLRPVSAGT